MKTAMAPESAEHSKNENKNCNEKQPMTSTEHGNVTASTTTECDTNEQSVEPMDSQSIHTDCNDSDDGFEKVLSKKKRRIESPKGANPTEKNTEVSRPKVKPLVLEGVSSETAKNTFEIRKLLKEANAEVAKLVTTKK